MALEPVPQRQGSPIAGQACPGEKNLRDAERQHLASLYLPGQSLWRVLIPHFDDPWDCNWGLKPPEDAEFPDQDPRHSNPRDHDCDTAGSIIGCQNQTLGEALGIAGTPFALHYRSDRGLGRKEAYRVDIPLSGAVLPPNLRRIELEVSVAGQLHRQTFQAAPDQETTFTWDGKNAYGQNLQGEQPITVRIGYTYPTVYGTTQRFGHFGGGAITASRARSDITLWAERPRPIATTAWAT
jgi:hypothetical protein